MVVGVFGLAFLAEHLNLQTLREGCPAFRAWHPEVDNHVSRAELHNSASFAACRTEVDNTKTPCLARSLKFRRSPMKNLHVEKQRSTPEEEPE